MLSELSEPRETRLGLSKAGSNGRGVGERLAQDVHQALSRSKAAATGLLQDLEDTILMVDGISHDIVSDITTNIIRKQLIEYTQQMCAFYGINCEESVDSGSLWNEETLTWNRHFVSLPVINRKKLLLVPKAIVRQVMEYDVQEYYRDYILSHLRRKELADPQSNLVKLIKSTGERTVSKKDLCEKYGTGKGVILSVTIESPGILEQYRRDKNQSPRPPVTNDQLLEAESRPPTDWDALFRQVKLTAVGRDGASQYEEAIEALLTALFYPSLTNPKKQYRIHDGRKRIDIVYTNMASTGFFKFLSLHFRCPHVFVECKNYSGDVGNPEIDQLSGRFAPHRGQVGFLVVRHFDDKDAFIQRCKDTAQDHRGFVIPLDDGDLYQLVEERRGATNDSFQLLKERFDQLTS